MEQEKILEVAVNTGTNLLICGAETYRVEDTIDRICKSYGLECEVFALPTVIVVSVKGEKGTSTICKRIPSRTVDLNKISLLNSLSRNIEKSTPSYDDITGELERISYCKKLSDSNIIFSYSLAAFIYVILFGGNLRDAAVAIPAGILLGLLRLTFSRGSNFPFIEYLADCEM